MPNGDGTTERPASPTRTRFVMAFWFRRVLMLLLVVTILEADEHSISFVGIARKIPSLIRKAQLRLDYFSQLNFVGLSICKLPQSSLKQAF